MKLTHLASGIALASVTAGGAMLAQGQDAASVGCTVSALQAKAPAGTRITSAAVVAANGANPQFCQVDGQVATPGNEVNFRLGLPQGWNGKYYFVGVGGTGGTIGRLDAGLARGYASASTDTGHLSSDTTWTSDAAKRTDYGYRGTHVTAVAGKALTESFYGRPPQHAYFQGCSNGGRQAFMELQRFPDDFDGVIAGDPATGVPMQIGRALVFQKLLANPESYLPIEKVEMLSRATVAACDARDGLKDGLVSDPRLCQFKPESLKCTGADTPNCLTAPQLAVVQQVYNGIKLPSGEVYTYPFPFGHEGDATGWQAWTIGRTPPVREENGTLEFTENRPAGFVYSNENFKMLASATSDPKFSWRTFDLGRDFPRLKEMTAILSPLDADLRPYKNRGGKVLMYHGWADPAISAYGTIDYYERMTKAVGGQQAAEAFARLYLVPGMHHCTGGPGPNQFDMLTALENWVEKRAAPQSIVATHSTGNHVDRTRPICPHPQVAKYTGTGSIDEATSFKCQTP
jgi:feruloyl esterase